LLNKIKKLVTIYECLSAHETQKIVVQSAESENEKDSQRKWKASKKAGRKKPSCLAMRFAIGVRCIARYLILSHL